MSTLAGQMQTATAETAGRNTGGVLSGAEQTALLTLLSTTTDGGFTIAIDGPTRQVRADFSGATTMVQAASVIQSQLSAWASCTWNAGTGQFIITSHTVGTTSTVGFAGIPVGGTNLGTVTGFKLATGTGAVLVAGTAPLGLQWIPCDGRSASFNERTPGYTPVPIPGTASTGTRMDYWRRVGRWSGVLGIMPRSGYVRIPYDPSGQYYVSVADNNSETSLVNPYTVQRPPPGVR